MIPEAWQNDPTMEQGRRDFYRCPALRAAPHTSLQVGQLHHGALGRASAHHLQRRKIRGGCTRQERTQALQVPLSSYFFSYPSVSRFYITADNMMVMASEVGVFDVPAEQVVQKGRLMPGKVLLVDTKLGKVSSGGVK